MKIHEINLETVCGITSKLPQHDKIEIAFWGRSNVGKSSLLNGLWNRKSLARTSSQPGKTQTINYYRVNDVCYMVDLPGYGYAKVSRELSTKWMKMIEKYFDTSRALRVVFLLVDIRHDPARQDIEMYRMLYNKGFNPLIIATKSDKISQRTIRQNTERIRTVLGADRETPILPFSALNKQGREEIWEYIDSFVETIPVD